jgi:hypothetical protein
MPDKIKLRKRRGSWWVFIDGPVPDFSRHAHWTDAVAKVWQELNPNLCVEIDLKKGLTLVPTRN